MEVPITHGLSRTWALLWMKSKHSLQAVNGLRTSLKPPGAFGAVWQASEEVSCGTVLWQPVQIFRRGSAHDLDDTLDLVKMIFARKKRLASDELTQHASD
jgi:hypothetical protein